MRNCRGFPLSADAAAGLLLAFIEQLVRWFDALRAGLFAEDYRHSVVCEQRIHELAIFFLAIRCQACQRCLTLGAKRFHSQGRWP